MRISEQSYAPIIGAEEYNVYLELIEPDKSTGGAGMMEMILDRGWEILQDVHGLGEEMRLYDSSFDNTAVGPQVSEWSPLERLAHLQTVLSPTPYFGRELRQYNQAPWWYRLDFHLPEEAKEEYAVLRFEAVDYYCTVWLNGRCLGSHRGYAAPFEFNVSDVMLRGRPNVLVVKVSSPWDEAIMNGAIQERAFSVVRGMAKGTYEHDDTLIQRDVNPVGIWRPVRLILHAGIRFSGRPQVTSRIACGETSAEVTIALPVRADRDIRAAMLRCRILDGFTDELLAETEEPFAVDAGPDSRAVTMKVSNPRLWFTWDRGEQPLYRAVAEITQDGLVLCHAEEQFGIRSIELVKSEPDTCFLLNGRKLFLRGTCYFPDAYLSEMHAARYRRDMELVKNAGFNAIRVHVHTPLEVLMDICDELGLAVLQDFDINWVHPDDAAWGNAAAGNFGEMIHRLRNHPSIIAWVCTNEPAGGIDGAMLNAGPGPQLMKTAAELDAGRPVIRGSGAWGDTVLSGDTHNYTGSLDGHGTHYTDIYGKTTNKWGFEEKLNTEFGFDAPGAPENLRTVPRVYERLKPLTDSGIQEIQYYQYRLLKYFIEHYRLMKYAPCSGYFQFMFIDLCPQSFYGVYDWWGLPKEGVKALRESNGPIGVFMLYKDAPGRLFAANDTLEELAGCTAEWRATDDEGRLLDSGSKTICLPADSLLEFAQLDFPVCDDRKYFILLSLRDASGKELARNEYADAFHHPTHPQGHPHRMSHELGMRLYWA